MSDTRTVDEGFPIITILMHRQDDPNKCTAHKIVRFKIAKEVIKFPYNSIILNPFSDKVLTKKDKEHLKGICAIDCSWNQANNAISIPRKLYANCRKLPALLAGNPTNYAKLGVLSTAEAIAGALYILNHKDKANEIMNKFKWGHTFIELNYNLLEDYSNAIDQNQIESIEKEYFPFIINDNNERHHIQFPKT
jgi:pre-rRNA-processing protein TSR3